MKTCKRLIALLLCAAMLFTLAACGKAPVETLPPPTEPPVTEAPPTEAPSAAERYQLACDALAEASGYTLEITRDKTTSVAGRKFNMTTEQTVSCTTENGSMLLLSDETVSYGGLHNVHYADAYSGGTYYTTVDETLRFCTEMDESAARARFLPETLLTAELYGSIDDSGTELTFSAPTAAESWAIPEGAKLADAAGTAVLGADGALTETSYTVSYTYGIAEVSETVTCAIAPAPESAPEVNNADDFTPITDPDALRLFAQAVGYLLQADAVSLTSSESVFSQAGGVLRNQSLTSHYDVTTGKLLSKDEYDLFLMDYNTGESQSVQQTNLFRDDVYTVSTGGSEPARQAGVTAESVRAFSRQQMLANLVDTRFWTDAVITDLGSVLLIECTMNEDMASAIRGGICTTLYSNADLLDDLASSYVTNESSAYFAVDTYTGLPTAAGFKYMGTHTIDGGNYPLTMQSDSSFNVPALETYHEITDEYLPETVPEEKATPLFYHVTGEKGEEMWLLGTIHVGDERTGFLPQEIYDAFDSADALALEFSSDAFDKALESDEKLQEQISACYYYSDGTTTKDHIADEELYEAALQLMRASGNYNMNTPYMKVGMWGSFLENFYQQQGSTLTSQQGVDNRLERRALEQEKKILDVESALFQFQMMSGYSDPLQEMLLGEALSASTAEFAASTQALYELWCRGDEAAMRAELENDISEMTEQELALYNEYNDAMIISRNAGMLETALSYLKSGDTVFFAVGLAHLLSGNGLVDTLREAGYTVELVTFAE